MAKTKTSKRNKTLFRVKIAECHEARVTWFKEAAFIHLKDTRKDKSVTFSKGAFISLMKKTDQIQKLIHQCEKNERLKEKAKASTSSSEDSEHCRD